MIRAPMEKIAGSMGWLWICLTFLFPPGCNALGREGYNCLIGGHENMLNPTLEVTENSLEALSLVLRWEPVQQGAALLLPDEYFSAYSLTDASGNVHSSASVLRTGPHELTIQVFDVELFIDADGYLDVQLLFPDREIYIPCSHPGAHGGDTYVVLFRIKYSETYEIQSVDVGQEVLLAPG